jgi:hypothetical protein
VADPLRTVRLIDGRKRIKVRQSPRTVVDFVEE